MAFERDTLDGGNASTANLDDLIDRLRIQGKDAFFQHYSLGMFKLCAEAVDAIERLRKERDEAKRIISKCADAINNGAFVAPECSLEFMAHVPSEIGLHTASIVEELDSWKECARAAKSRAEELEVAIQRIGKRARSDGNRTFDDAIRDLGWIDDECRALGPSPKGGEE